MLIAHTRALDLPVTVTVARTQHLKRLQQEWEERAKVFGADAPVSDPVSATVLQRTYPHDSHETIAEMVRFLESLGTHRRAVTEQRARDRDAALLAALDATGDGRVQYR